MVLVILLLLILCGLQASELVYQTLHQKGVGIHLGMNAFIMSGCTGNIYNAPASIQTSAVASETYELSERELNDFSGF